MDNDGVVRRIASLEQRLLIAENKLSELSMRFGQALDSAPARSSPSTLGSIGFTDLTGPFNEFKSVYPKQKVKNLVQTERHYRECLADIIDSTGADLDVAAGTLNAKARAYAESKEGQGVYARQSDVWLRERAYLEEPEAWGADAKTDKTNKRFQF